MRLLICLALLVLLTSCTHNTKRVDLVSVYDGDTIRVNIGGWPAIVGEGMPVRLRGINTPEIRAMCPEEKALAIEARDYLDNALRSAGSVELADIERGKYFRLVADVLVDGEPIAPVMIGLGLGRAYGGGKRLEWCAKTTKEID